MIRWAISGIRGLPIFYADSVPRDLAIAATFSACWIINLILHTLDGTFSLLYVNIAKTFVYENDSH